MSALSWCQKINRSRAHDSRTNHAHTNTERATAQRRLIVEVVVAARKLPPSAALLLLSLLSWCGEVSVGGIRIII